MKASKLFKKSGKDLQQIFDIILNIGELEIFKHKIKGWLKMQNSALFSGFSDLERQKMLKCLGAKIKKCKNRENQKKQKK